MALITERGDGTFADGVREAARLIGWFETWDPVLLRSLASSLENLATTGYELGVARGLRLAADDVEDRIGAARAEHPFTYRGLHAVGAGATVKEVSVMLGHANPSVTLRVYTGVLNSMSEQTDERLDAAFRAAVPERAADVVQLAR
jgi:hypothetical protein